MHTSSCSSSSGRSSRSWLHHPADGVFPRHPEPRLLPAVPDLLIFFGIFLSIAAVLLEEISFRRYPGCSISPLLVLGGVLENFGFRQLLSLFKVKAFWDYLWRRKTWGQMDRQGFRKAGAGASDHDHRLLDPPGGRNAIRPRARVRGRGSGRNILLIAATSVRPHAAAPSASPGGLAEERLALRRVSTSRESDCVAASGGSGRPSWSAGGGRPSLRVRVRLWQRYGKNETQNEPSRAGPSRRRSTGLPNRLPVVDYSSSHATHL